MKTDLFSNVMEFLKNEKIEIIKRKISESEFLLESPDSLITVKFVMNNINHEILYDIYSSKYYIHLKEETLKDVERLESIAEDYGNWNFAKTIEDIWLILDEIKYWAYSNEFGVKEKELF